MSLHGGASLAKFDSNCNFKDLGNDDDILYGRIDWNACFMFLIFSQLSSSNENLSIILTGEGFNTFIC